MPDQMRLHAALQDLSWVAIPEAPKKIAYSQGPVARALLAEAGKAPSLKAEDAGKMGSVAWRPAPS